MLPTSARKFATLDAKAGYWQIPLDEASQELTTFITPWGRYKFLRNPMGLTSAQDEYCRRGDEALAGLDHLRKVVDDILIFGESNQELLTRVVEVLERCRENGITLNPKKFNFGQDKVDYVGYEVSAEGVTADPRKLSAIADFPTPANLVDLRSFMGLVNQLADFTSGIAEAAEPLRNLMKPRNAFIWTADHDVAFQKVKQSLVNPPNTCAIRRITPHHDPDGCFTPEGTRLRLAAAARREMEAGGMRITFPNRHGDPLRHGRAGATRNRMGSHEEVPIAAPGDQVPCGHRPQTSHPDTQQLHARHG